MHLSRFLLLAFASNAVAGPGVWVAMSYNDKDTCTKKEVPKTLQSGGIDHKGLDCQTVDNSGAQFMVLQVPAPNADYKGAAYKSKDCTGDPMFQVDGTDDKASSTCHKAEGVQSFRFQKK